MDNWYDRQFCVVGRAEHKGVIYGINSWCRSLADDVVFLRGNVFNSVCPGGGAKMVNLPDVFDFANYQAEMLGFCAYLLPIVGAFSAYYVLKKIIKGL